MTAMELIDEYVNRIEIGKPIYTKDIYEYVLKQIPSVTNESINTYINRYEKKNEMFNRYKKGIYYKSVNTPFGKSTIDIALVEKHQYLEENGEIYGFISGPSLLNRVGVSTQIPKDIYITTNNYRRKMNNDNIVLKKPVIEITEENILYLTTLDLINERHHVELTEDEFKIFIYNYIKLSNLSFEGLLFYANKYKDKNLVLYIASIAGGVDIDPSFK